MKSFYITAVLALSMAFFAATGALANNAQGVKLAEAGDT